jgi:thiamine-phosphate pyrophosphorylase
MTDNSPRRAESRPLDLPALYPIVDVDLCRMRGRDPVGLAAAFAEGGARLMQVRQKSGGSSGLLALCRDIIVRTREAKLAVLVNDRADLAVMAGAAGVHVGQDDLPVPAVRRIVGPEAVIGLSTHTPAQVDDGLQMEIDYLAVGPVFHTATKDTGYPERGLELIRYAAGRGRPVVAIGGLTLDTAPAALEAGAASVAIISDLLAAADPAARVRQYLARLRQGSGGAGP